MIRFAPDNWLEAVLRPLAMALPQASVYTEIIAPDMRFAILAFLGVLYLWFKLFGRQPQSLSANVRVLLLVIALSFPVWLATGGNGRYFMPMILLVGPLLVALWRELPLGGIFKWSMLGVFAVLQVVAIATNPPWQPFDTLEWVRWRGADYFELDTRAISNLHGATYVTLPGQSNSLVAPLFPHHSHWINLTSFEGQDLVRSTRPVVAEARRRLTTASDLRLLVRAQPREAHKANGLPNETAWRVLNVNLNAFGLKLSNRTECILLPSKTLAEKTPLTLADGPEAIAALKAHAGFWACPLDWAPTLPQTGNAQDMPVRADQAVRKVESLCPRLFPPGQIGYLPRRYGYERGYSASDSNISYVVEEDKVYVKMQRALNPQAIGKVDDILKPDFQLDCNGFVGREAIPWKRTI